MLICTAALHISCVEMALLIRRAFAELQLVPKVIYNSEAAEQIIYWGGPTLHEVVEHDLLISLRGKGGLYWVMMESII